LERGIYFDGWYRDEHCYHPSLPMRRTQMIDDLVDYEATILVWSALGGGVVSLPYLEEEAYGEVPARLRFYGYMNDVEFIRECGKRGIKVFGVVFEVQGWEFPAELSEDETRLLGLNVTRGEGKKGWYGLREFSQDRYPGLFPKSFRDYFPDGLTNADGESVTDLWEECAARRMDGSAVHAGWVEVVGHEQICYQMCRNNPVWRDYLKKIIEIQIDAGVHGVHLDECELPITAIGYGGCFCKDCMKQFRAYLLERQTKGDLPKALQEMDLTDFHYGRYLSERNVEYPGKPGTVPFFAEYFRFQMTVTTRYFKELTDHIRAYGRKRGRDVLVSGNFFHVMHQYMPLEPEVDIVVTEMRQTLYRQASWYRFAAGFAGDKPITIVENPYGGIVPELLENLKQGKMAQQFQLMLLEAAAFGTNLSVPYGGWMGNTIRDAFYAPKEPTMQVQRFLKDNDRLLSRKSGAEILIPYSYPSYYWRENEAAEQADDQETMLSSHVSKSVKMPFWDVLEGFSKRHIPYDVTIASDDELFEDKFDLPHIGKYRQLVLADCNKLTDRQLQVVHDYLEQGGQAVVYGRLADSSASPARELVMRHANTTLIGEDGGESTDVDRILAVMRESQPGGLFQIELEGDEDIGIHPHLLENGDIAIHVVNYGFDRDRDRVISLPNVTLSMRCEQPIARLETYTLDGSDLVVDWSRENGRLRLTIRELPLYGVIECVHP
jgi:hypothetical protein